MDTSQIVAALEASDPQARERAIALAAQHVAPELLGRLVGNDENAVLRNSALSALERQGPYAVPHLMALSRDENLEVAMFAVQVLSRIKDPTTVDALLPLVGHPDTNIAQAAVEALGALRARAAVPALIRLLDADLWLQFAAVAALGEIGDDRAVGPLLDAVPNEMLCEPAVEALAKLAAPAAMPQLLELLADHDRLPLRDFVLRAVSVILEAHVIAPSVFTRFRRKLDEGGLETGLVEYLSLLLSAGDAALRRAAASIALAAQLERLYPEVVLRTLSPDPEEARWAAALCRRHERALRGALGALFGHADPRVRQSAVLAAHGDTPSVLPLLDDPSAEVRAAACLALGRSRDVAAVPALVERFERGEPLESQAAAEALGGMPGQSLLLLAPFLAPPTETSRLIAALGILDAARSPLFEDEVAALLEAPQPPVRRAAMRVLVHQGGVDFEQKLVDKLADPDESVRIEAVELIVRNGSTRAVPPLIGLLSVSDDLRYHAIRALGRLRAAAAAPALEALFALSSGHERLEIVSALVRIAAPGILRFLEARLASQDTEVRRVAADGLARLASAAELPLLVQLAGDADWSIRNHAGWGLGRLGLPGGREALLALVRDPEAVVARTARVALTKLPA